MLRYTTGRGAKARVMRSSDAAMRVDKGLLFPPLEQEPRVDAARERPPP